MGSFLKIIGGLTALYFSLGRAATGFFSQIDYSYLPIRRQDINIVIDNNRVIGKIRIRMSVINRSPLNLTIKSFFAQISQQDQILGQVYSNSPIELISQEEKTLGFDLAIGAKDFLDRLSQIMDMSNASLIAPLKIQGVLELSNGKKIPISTQVNFFTVG